MKALFSGAPYFFLENGKHGRWYPQVIFPWDDHDPSIQDMWDRKPLPHSSYTLATLHAHLPIPDGWVVKGDTPVNLSSWRVTGSPKRGTFDIGVYEVPNMLSMNGREPGSTGFRHFLELPVADSIHYVGPEKPKPRPEAQQFATLPATEAFDLMERYNDPYCECDDGTVHDRKKLLCDGPVAWKRIGVRDINLKCMVDRMGSLRRLRHEALYDKPDKTILDVESQHGSYQTLFSKFLHHPPHFMKLANGGDPKDVKSQIRVLATVLATPGAWFNFSLPEWRFRAGQVLWEAPPHVDGDCLERESCDESSRRSWIDNGLERKWFLVQMLLAGELLLRLDGIVCLGRLHGSDNLAISQQDVQCFEEIQNDKLNWDLIVVRRFFDCFNIGMGSPVNGQPPSPEDKQNGKHHRFPFFGNLAHKMSSSAISDSQSAWECHLSPIHVEKQLAGLFVFAENVGWPELDSLKSHIKSKIGDGDLAKATSNMYSHPVRNVLPGDGDIKLGRDDMYSRSSSRRLILLNSPGSQQDTSDKRIGGWITRSWLSAFVVPGKGIDHILMATILESDPEAINTLGPVANIYGGFSYKRRSWWSKECIVGRVLASMDDTKACMGWSSNAILPLDASTSKAFENTWFEVIVRDLPDRSKKHRIKQGHKLAARSTPLGVGEMSMESFTLPVDEPLHTDSRPTVNFRALTFTPKEEQPRGKSLVVSKESNVSFDLRSDSAETSTTISFPLTYNVRFVASQECRPPYGHTSSPSDHDQGQEHGTEHSRLPGHPLHKFYAYKYIPLQSLPQTPRPEKSASDKDTTSPNRYEVLVVDARGGSNEETFARAWCASVGSHAVIGRVSRTCLACCIRETHAIKAGVVIRVGDGERDHTSSVHEIHVDNK